MREAQELAEPTYDYFAQPLSDNLFEWHFTVRGPAETEFDGGIYHGRIVLPPDYPMKPPNIIVLTPNGRFEIGKKICLSISGYRPETWQPSWSIRTALLAIIGFMPTPSKGTIGSLDYPAEERKKLAKKSLSYACPDCGIVAEFLKSQNNTEDSITSTAEEAKEIIKTMSMKEEGTDDKKVDTENKVKEETEEERYKRARKLYSERMQIIIKKRLNQDIWLTQQNSTSTDTSNSTSSSATTTMSNASTSLHLLLQEEDLSRDNHNNNQFNHNKVEHHLFKELINSKPGTTFMILSYLSSLLSLVSYFIGDLLFQWTYLRTQHLNLVISEQNF